MDTEMQEIIEKIDAFFDKRDVTKESRYMITRRMSEDYWNDMWDEDSEENGVDEGFDDDFETSDDSESEDVDEGFDDDDLEVPDKIPPLEVPKPPSKHHQSSMKAKLKSLKPKRIKE